MARETTYPEPLVRLLRELRKLPGVGPRSAERMGLWLLTAQDAKPGALAECLRTAAEQVRPCEACGFFALGPLCPICEDPARAGRELCVVEQATDIMPIESTGNFRGRYHALGGRIAPLDHVGPEDLRIDGLLARVESEKPGEVILALSADVEGEATTGYLVERLAASGVPVTRIAHGLPAGGGLDQADALTLRQAFLGRKAV